MKTNPRSLIERIRMSRIGFEWLVITALIVLLILYSKPWLRWTLLGIIVVALFRVAYRIPLLGKCWVWLFGERQFWDWMSLLCAPFILAFLGFSISNSFNESQGDISIVRDRLNMTNEYYKQMSDLILQDDFQKIIIFNESKIKNNQSNSSLETLKIFKKNHHLSPSSKEISGLEAYLNTLQNTEFKLLEKEVCDPIQRKDLENINYPKESITKAISLASIGYTKTISTLRSLSSLRTSDEKYTPLKKGIVQLLRYSGLINRYSHIISLQTADLSDTNLSNIDLSGSCFDSVLLNGSNLYASKLSNSNIKRASLKNANLELAKLQRVNFYKSSLDNTNLRGAFLSEANLQDTSLIGADLRGANLSGTIINKRTNLKNAIYNDIEIKASDTNQPFQRIINILKIFFRFETITPSFNIQATNFNGIQYRDGITESIIKKEMKKENR